ncbi:MAG: 3'(2'),5'-bisphosphate nucleotidase [Verrucomicrobiota bacterium]
MFDFRSSAEWSTAIPALQVAARCTEAVRTSFDPAKLDKSDKSPVTIADFGAQALILDRIKKDFPNDDCVAEEDSQDLIQAENQSLLNKLVSAVVAIDSEFDQSRILDSIDHGNHEGGDTGRIWTLDPIDGTKGFLRNDQYAIALGLIVDGELAFGAMACPNLPLQFKDPTSAVGSLFWAIKGKGAWMSPLNEVEAAKSIQVKEISDLSHASFCESVESGHSSHGHSAQIAERLGVTAPPVRIDSQCKYAAVARADASIYLRLPTRAGYEEKIWDHAAGALIVEEAGGKVSDIEGKPLDFSLGRTLKDNRGVVASNRAFHDQIIAAIKQVIST